jgi:hypothetical protein
MRLKLFALVWCFTLGLSPVVLAADQDCCKKAAAACCDQAAVSGHSHGNMACCKDGTCDMPGCKGNASDMPCCKDAEPEVFASAIDVLIAIGGGLDLSLAAPDVPVSQTAVVWFHRPVWIGRNVLQGKFVIEHDTGRMARGEPCTHIYAADNPTKPVVAFHCTHIAASRAAKDTVMLETLPDGMRRLVLFQFAGDEAAHGYPAGR